MKIALVGYGKMGHMVESCAKSLGHEVVSTIDVFSEDATVRISPGDEKSLYSAVKSSGADGVIEFSHPSSVMERQNRGGQKTCARIRRNYRGICEFFDRREYALQDCGGSGENNGTVE